MKKIIVLYQTHLTDGLSISRGIWPLTGTGIAIPLELTPFAIPVPINLQFHSKVRTLDWNCKLIGTGIANGVKTNGICNWKRQIRRSSEIAARRRIAANDQKKFTKNYIFETLKKYYIF